MKLGELLVREGKLSSADVEETLKGQAIFGGRFGTNLVEMGLLDESELARYLSRKSGVPHAPPELFMNIPPQVIKLLPLETVKKYRVVPLALNNRKLSLAMADPSNFAAIDEISFATGFIVVPHVTPEIRIITALEKYYNVKRDLRFIPFSGGGRNRGRMGQLTAPISDPASNQSPVTASQTAPALPSPPEPEEIDIFEIPPLNESDTFADLEELGSAQQLPAAFASWQKPPRPTEPEFSLESVLRGLTEAQDRNEVADLVVGYAARHFAKAALFLVKGGQATGWIAQTGTTRLEGFDALEVWLQEPSALRAVVESKTYYLGATPITPCNSRIFAALGAPPSQNQFLAPLIMMGRVVAVFYLEGGSKRLDESIPDLQKLIAKISMAFEILILKGKILAK